MLNLDLHICCQFFLLQVYIFKEVRETPVIGTRQNKFTRALKSTYPSSALPMLLCGWFCSLLCQVVALRIEPP